MFCKNGVLRNFSKFTAKHLCQRLFFNNVASLGCFWTCFWLLIWRLIDCRRQQMIWLENHDIVLLREILHIHPWSKPHGSVKRGQLWDEIAVLLNSLEDMNFQVTTRSDTPYCEKVQKRSGVRKISISISTVTCSIIA